MSILCKSVALLVIVNLCTCITSKNTSTFDDTFSSIYWQVEDHQGDQHFLLGTMHVVADFKSLPHSVIASLNSSDLVITELRLQDTGAIGQSMVSQNPHNISTRLGKTYVEKSYNIFQDKGVYGITKERIDQLSLVELYSSLVSLATKTTGTQADYQANRTRPRMPLDFEIMIYAQKIGKPMIALETPKEQLHALQTLCTPEYIKQSIDTFNEVEQQVKSIVTSYQSMSLGKSKSLFADTLHKTFTQMSEHEIKTLLYDRNRKWIPRLKEIFNGSKGSFVAFGAAHLPGEWGIINLLSLEGYKVKRVSPQ